MEYLLNLNRKNSEDEDLAGVKMQYSFTPQPSLSRKYSNVEIETLFKQVKGKTKIFGICGGTSCGKSKITNYFHSKIEKSIVLCEVIRIFSLYNYFTERFSQNRTQQQNRLYRRQRKPICNKQSGRWLVFREKTKIDKLLRPRLLRLGQVHSKITLIIIRQR